jgi:phosphatidylserine/phosphatidylglycerophosphate/cardiolipin synthase-like enzyme
MIRFPVGVVEGSCHLLSDERYPAALVDLLRAARNRCLVSMFIVDTSGMTTAVVDEIIASLEAAVWRGLDVRVILGGSRINWPIAETAAGSARIFHDRQIPSRWLTSETRRGSHMKTVVVDDTVLVGSHNWSVGAFAGQHQDTVLVSSPELAAYLSGLFDEQWNRAAGAT